MSRITKVMLEEDNRILRNENKTLREEVRNLKEMKQFLIRKDFDVDAFCRMHAEAVTAIAHVVTDTRGLIQKLY